jgi:hypothetical protein
MRLTEKELENILNRKGSGQEQQNKMRAVICDADGIKFPSKKHRNHYLLLKAMQFAGEIKFILREIPFDLPGHYDNGRIVRHYVDFMVCLPDDTFRYLEVKGRDLPMGKLKRKQVEDIYKIQIELV